MGCVSSKLVKKELRRDIILNNGGEYVNHVVSLTSSTYGVLNLDKEQKQQPEEEPIKEIDVETKKKNVQRSTPRGEPEVINAWELMEGLEEEMPVSNHPKKSPKSRTLLRGFADVEGKSPLKFFNQFGSPRKVKKFGESYSPLFDPELVESYERELSEEKEHVKRVILPTFTTRKAKISSDSILESFKKKCPPGGENAVVIYTTTLRGIRKTFEECNNVRSIIESHQIQMFERDISMDSGFKEELRTLMETKEVKVPLVFVKGRLVGGVDEVVKMEEEGKLGILFEGIPKAMGGCEGCGGVRFVMCMECNGKL
ncbi:hypothetical protein Patl1_32533 [Pistacia atlantica]|uniref:Uncharacterized protein n=1 Tax=Pistacia atlantica TaxID=434234 RepID=A0ACC1AQT0_9ROSI|nr:hypothetical protein Patl1_32533 [Pistacia atlantica]